MATISGCSSPMATQTSSPTPTPTATIVASPTASPTVAATAGEQTWYNGNIYGITDSAQNPTVIRLSKPAIISYIQTYHWNRGNGVAPGTISLRGEDGTVYGPWQATGENGQGGVPNAYWVVYPAVALKAGKYTIVDSDPSTWSTNEWADYVGMAKVKYNETA